MPASAPALVALLCAGSAVALLWPVRAASLAEIGPTAALGRRRRVSSVVVAGLGVVLVLMAVLLSAAVTLRQAVLLLITLATVQASTLLLRRRRAARSAEQTSVRLLEACEQLTGELVAGQPPEAALEHCAVEWQLVAPVAEAFRVGADVPGAWREAAQHPGAGDLRLVAAAWQVSHRTGAGLASALEHVTADLRAQHATRRVVAGELASARATARLVAVLPVLALTFGSGTGADPWGFLLGHPVGLACLALGLTFALVGLTWIEALARQVEQT